MHPPFYHAICSSFIAQQMGKGNWQSGASPPFWGNTLCRWAPHKGVPLFIMGWSHFYNNRWMLGTIKLAPPKHTQYRFKTCTCGSTHFYTLTRQHVYVTWGPTQQCHDNISGRGVTKLQSTLTGRGTANVPRRCISFSLLVDGANQRGRRETHQLNIHRSGHP